jgi:adenylylsulfate kinase
MATILGGEWSTQKLLDGWKIIMKLRKIKLQLLGASGIVYRLHVIFFQTLFFYFLIGQWKWAFGTSIAWNIINTFLYYNYHYWFAKLFSIGKRDIKKGHIIWLTGLSGSGKSTLAEMLLNYYKKNHKQVILLDGDIIRKIFPSTGFSIEERNAHVKRVGYTATLLAENGINVICSLISPFNESREYVRNLYNDFKLVYIKCELNECIKRDVKGLYKKAMSGEIKDFTGISHPFDEPINPDLIIETDKENIKESFSKLLSIISI